MTTRKPDDKGQADPNAVELTDAELDKASGGILNDDNWRTDPKTGQKSTVTTDRIVHEPIRK